MRALRRQEINLAVVGGVDLNAEPRALQAQDELLPSSVCLVKVPEPWC